MPLTKALLIERDQLRREVRRLALLAEQLQAHLDEALAVLYSAKRALPPGAEQDRVFRSAYAASFFCCSSLALGLDVSSSASRSHRSANSIHRPL